jgi:light-regulated signal transduction histidine kinase (bacteriophytochrome)
MVNGKLWGLVICHHGEPRYLDARTRAGLEICAQLASLQITSNAELAEAAEYGRARQVAARMLSAMIADGVGRLLTGEPNALNLIPAAGAALMVRGELTLLGQTPTTAQIRGVVQWLTAIGEGVYATDRLRDHYPPAAGFLNTASGLLALSISDPQRDYLLWFLPELVSEVTWAGDPARPMSNRLMGVPPKPRKSFAAWIETVRGRARPWSRLEKKTADAIRIALLELVAPQIDGRVGQPGDPAGDDPDPVMAELEHRVNTALASIQAATRLSNRSADATIDYVRALEHRIGAMAKSHGPLTAA